MKKEMLIAAAILLVIGSVLSVVLVPARAQHAGHTPPPAKSEEMPSMPGMPGMPASPKAETAPEAMPKVEISLEKQQLIGVKTVKAEVKPLQKVIRTVGRIEYDEKKLSTINIKTEGWIEKLYVDYTGRYVKKGEPLAEIYSPELLATQREYLNIVKYAKQPDPSKKNAYGEWIERDASAIAEAARERLRLWDISEAQIRKIEETGKPVRTLTLYSPVSGYVTQKMALQGMKVMPGEKLFEIADLSTLWVIADIYEYELASIKAGDRAVLTLSYLPGQEFASAIDYVYPTLAAETRTAKVRFVIPNKGGKLKPQMFTDVEIKMGLGSRLAVPRSAVINTGTRQIVYVDKGKGHFEPREVQTGIRSEGMVEIRGGLSVGEKVAASGNFLIDSEAQLKGVQPLQHKH